MLCGVCATVRCTLKANGTPPLLYFSPIQLHLVCDFFLIGTFNIKMWFAEEYNEHFSEFRASVSFFFFFNSNYMSICPVTEKEDHNQLVFANGMDYLRRSLKMCKVTTFKSTGFQVI